METEGDAALIVRARKCGLRILSAVCLVVLTLWTGIALAASSPGAPDRESLLSPSQPPSLLQPPKPAVPATRIEPDKPAGPLPAGGPRILVRGFRIDGDSPAPPAALQALLPVPVIDGIEAAAWQALAMVHMQASKATVGGFSRVHQREVTGLAPSLVRHMAE